ncbi:conserved hypothetical protein [delta proteobacterium NaphS2]|nr:conserved hypothetical protein [delta proteobacterium NaphS2]
MTTEYLNEFIKISPGFKSAVNLKNDRNNLKKVAGFIPTEIAKEIILDLGKKLHPSSDLRSRIIMGTYGTGKSHLALVLLNFFAQSFETPALQVIVDKLDPDTQIVLKQYRSQIPKNFLVVNLYGDEGDIADALMMGLRQALEKAGLEYLLPPSAFDAALKRIEEIEKSYADNFAILKEKAEENGMTVDELKTRLENYQKKAFDLFREIHPFFSAGGRFEYTTMLTPTDFYTSVVKELIEKHDFSGIAIFWDEFGHKMGEVVKDPTGKEGLVLQEFAECCNDSLENQLHFYIFCHRSLKEYHDISMSMGGGNQNQLEEDLRKIEGRFKPYMMKSTDVETFELIDAVIVADKNTDSWNRLTDNFSEYFEKLVEKTAKLRFFTGFTQDELKETVVLGSYPLHPMAVYSLPAISEKVAQNNRTLFTCLCEDEPGSFKRFLDKAVCRFEDRIPPMFTVDHLWDYFSSDVKQQERSYSIYRDFEHLKARLSDDDLLGLRILKAVSVFRVTNPARVKVTEETLSYALSIPDDELAFFKQELERHSDLKNENHILMKLQADGSYRPAVSSATESLMEKVRKLLNDFPEKLGQSPVQYLKSLWKQFGFNESYEATSYGDDFGVLRQLEIEPVSMNQLKESLHILTKNLGSGSYTDGILLVVFCSNSSEIEEAKQIATSQLSEFQYQQVVIAIPKEPIRLFASLREHQALAYLKRNEASLYAEGGELHEEWCVYDSDRSTQLKDTIDDLFAPEKQMLDYFWMGQYQEIINTRQIKKLASSVMNKVFPDCPIIGEPKLTKDDFGGNWGYRKDCRDITMKLTRKDAAEKLWEETAAAPKHIITQLLKSNKILRKNQAGDCVLEKPDPDSHNGACKTWECMEKYIKKARQAPLKMELMVRALRKPPHGLKCRVMPILFAAVANKELALGNISFEFQRTASQIEKITAIENETLEKIFTSPEKYKLVYVNVSSNQNALINALSKLYEVNLLPSDPPLERVKKVGKKVGEWWRALPKHAQLTDEISDEASLLKDYVFKPLAELAPDTQQILLKDIFEHVFDEAKKITPKQVEDRLKPFKEEFELVIEDLKSRIFGAYSAVFGQMHSPDQELSMWFSDLHEDKQNYTYNGEPAILINACRKTDEINTDTLLEIAKNLSGLDIESWGDELVLFFQGKLDAARNHIDTFAPPLLPVTDPEPDPDLEPGQIKLSVFSHGKTSERILDAGGDISSNGQVLENMLNSTIEQLSKGMDEKERTRVLLKIIEKHVFGRNN